MRQGGDPRLPLELALVKVTRPAADLERESLAFRLEQLEARGAASPAPTAAAAEATPVAPQPPPPRRSRRPSSSSSSRTPGSAPSCRRSSRRAAFPPPRSCARPTRPGWRATRSPSSSRPPPFHRKLAEEPKNATLLADALYEVTGRRFSLDFALGENGGEDVDDTTPAGEDEILALMKKTFDAREATDEEDR